MKNIFTLFVLLLSIAGLSSKAQNTNCNAEFSVAYLTGNTVQFNPVVGGTIAGIHHIWYFGEGGSSALAAPVYTYGAGGVFTAEHIIIVQNPNGVEVCRDTFYRVVQVQNICNLAANFYSNHDSIGTVPNTYIFVNTTLPLNTSDSVRWTFGDGTSSNQFNPHHTYAQPGTYTVCLRVQQRNSAGGLTNCVSEICHPVVVVSPSACTLVANFVFSGTASSPFTYHFENTSTPLNTTDSIRWTFGDGTSSNQVNPTHTYTAAGTYTVCLRIQKRDPNGGLTNCIKEICHIVIVTNPISCNLVASFSYGLIPGAINTYHFENTSTPLNTTDSIRWTF
ncbi:MAG: PKD domain-containing protein, partial [Ferruginibacter sp.]